jgi:hypothetical protein
MPVMKLLFCLFYAGAQAAKLHPWLNTENSLIEGDLPSVLSQHRLASPSDDKVYLFGGSFSSEGDFGKNRR